MTKQQLKQKLKYYLPSIKMLKNYLEKFEVKIKGFIDNNTTNKNTYKLKDIDVDDIDYIFIISPNHSKEIYAQTIRTIDKQHIVLVSLDLKTNKYNFFNDTKHLISKEDELESYFQDKSKSYTFENSILLVGLGFIDINGNVITTCLRDIDGDKLIFRRKIGEGTFLILMRTDLDKQITALIDKVKSIEKYYKSPFIFINECYGIEIIKNPLYRKREENPLPYFLEFYKDLKQIDKYIVGDNCIGWLSYGETISKDIMRLHNNLSFTGVVFELEDTHINWRDALKNFNFTDEEIEIIVNLIYEELDIRELSKATKIPEDRLRDILDKLEKKGIVKYLYITDTYYIDNLKDALKKIAEELDLKCKIKREGRERLLRML